LLAQFELDGKCLTEAFKLGRHVAAS
jgi:hypothetical protein